METAKRIKLYALDMEWSKQEGLVQPLEIGLLPMEGKEDPYFSLIAPSDVERLQTRVFGFLRQKKASFMKAPSFDAVVREMRKIMIPGGVKAAAVVWHEDTKVNFVEACKVYKVRNPFSAIVSLKDIMIMGRKGQVGSFERAMSEYNISYQERYLHHSSYDVIHMKRLIYRYIERCKETERPFRLLLNEHTGIIHADYCQYVAVAEEHSIRDFDIKDLFSGTRLCKKCCRKLPPWAAPFTDEERSVIKLGDNVRKIKYDQQFQETSVAGMCAHFGFDYAINGQMIDIKTPCGRWRLYHNEKEVISVTHGNHYGKNSRRGYHKQKGIHGPLYKVLSYISTHDSAIEKHEVRQPKKHKDTTEMMVKKVSHHTKRNYYVEKDEWEEYYD